MTDLGEKLGRRSSKSPVGRFHPPPACGLTKKPGLIRVNFDPDILPNDPFKEHYPFKPKNDVAKSMAADEIIEEDDLDDIKVILPWKLHVNPDIPKPDPTPKQANRTRLEEKTS